MKILIVLLAIVSANTGFARSIMAEYGYRLKANRDYHTGLHRAYDAPVAGSRIQLEQRGEYCNLIVTHVEYTTVNYGALRTATALGGGRWEIPDGTVYALDVYFRQRVWDDVDCELKIYSEDGGGPTIPKPAPSYNDCDYLGGHGSPKEVGNWYRINLPLVGSDFAATKPYRDSLVRKLSQAPARVACYTNCLWDQALSCRDLLKAGDNVLESWFQGFATAHLPTGIGTVKVFGGFTAAEDTTNSH